MAEIPVQDYEIYHGGGLKWLALATSIVVLIMLSFVLFVSISDLRAAKKEEELPKWKFWVLIFTSIIVMLMVLFLMFLAVSHLGVHGDQKAIIDCANKHIHEVVARCRAQLPVGQQTHVYGVVPAAPPTTIITTTPALPNVQSVTTTTTPGYATLPDPTASVYGAIV